MSLKKLPSITCLPSVTIYSRRGIHSYDDMEVDRRKPLLALTTETLG